MRKNFMCIDCHWHWMDGEDLVFICPKCGSSMILQEERITMEL